MSARAAVRVAWSVWVVCAVLVCSGLLLLVLARSAPLPPEANPWGAKVADLATLMIYPTLGALIVARHPRNPVGWLFSAASLAGVFTSFADAYAVYALRVEPASLPFGETMAWSAELSWKVGVGLAPFVLVLFPGGRLPSRRWRPLLWVLVANYAVTLLVTAFSPGPTYEALSPENPFGAGGAVGETLRVLDGVSEWSLLAFMLASVISMLVRFRRASGDERKQIEWVAGAVALLTVVLISTFILDAPRSWESLAEFCAFLCPPVAAGIAVLKHRLYDIDVLINRALVYGVLTISLAAVYFGGVALLQGLFRTLTGQGSTLAVVVFTLVIAALFHPLRRRIQAVIDRRFFRKKYDAAGVLAGFNVRLREEVDLDALGGDLVGVIEETMRPEHISLWLRAPEHGVANRL